MFHSVNFLDRLKKQQTKKGLASIEVVIGMILFIIVFASICDFLVISNRYASLTDTAKELARTISVQGGSLDVKPGAYSANYYNIQELGLIVKKQMNGMGFTDDEYSVYIEYTKIYDNENKETKEVDYEEKIIGEKADGTYGVIKATERIEYLSDFTLKIEASYNWPFTKSTLRLKPATLRIQMPGLSEWRYNYDGWTEEG